jgi:RNA polymerase II subunit A small phosphatase-like protein
VRDRSHPKLLILDLDETLLFASERPLERPPDFTVGEYHVYVRPHLDQFLRFCFSHFEVAIWTSSTEPYARAIVERVLPAGCSLAFLWTRGRCTACVDHELSQVYWVKDLRKVRRKGYRIEHVLVVDDTTKKLERSYGNLIRVRSFEGNAGDAELLCLERYLTTVEDAPNVRVIDKREWRRHAGCEE